MTAPKPKSGSSLHAQGLLRPLSIESLGTCDWGNCDELSYAERWELQQKQWLSVCRTHAGRFGVPNTRRAEE